MNFEILGTASSRLGRSISFGFEKFGKGYRLFLLILALLIGIIVGFQHRHMELQWLGCGGDVKGSLYLICIGKAWVLPSVLGLIAGAAVILPWAALLGISKVMRLVKFQKAFEIIGLKNSLGLYPTAIDIHEKKDRSQWLTILSNGIGIDRFKDRLRDLESALALGINSIESGNNPSVVRISLFGSILPRVCEYSKLKDELIPMYSFLVGKSSTETVIQNISSLPHLLIAGTTGGGKSVFFKQALVGLLSSSPRIQMYLFDLKGGVEMNVFSSLPNVQVYKNEVQAVSALAAINEEMDRRLRILTSKGHTKVDFERDKLDMIVVGVDEASELYGKSSNKSEQVVIDKARELTDRLTKLARATGIHVILATQKVLKETIDTKIQENIGGRMIFRMNTLQGSMTVLGNKMALELPDVPGRAIWSSGNKFIEVQAPLLSDEELKKYLKEISEDFEEEGRKNFGKMLCPVMKESEVITETIATG